ncbi:MAG: hypothetical protein FJ161_03020 [Gammaproteobacteria bacterium]|nr:hypothetical protein [Gammaproteobacteria bacterium]
MQDNPEPFKTIKYKLPSQLQEILDLEQPILVPTNQSDNQNHPEVTTTASSTIIDNIEDKTITPPSENQTLERSHSTNNNEPLEIQSEIKNEPTNLSTRLNRYWNGFLIIVGITIVGFSFGIGSPLGIGLTCLGAAGLTRAYDQITTQHEAESLDARNRRNTIILATSLIILGLVIGSITMGIGSPLTVACVCIGLGLFSEIISANMHHHRRKKIPEQSQLLHSLQSAKAKKTKRKIKPKKSVVQRLLPKFLNTSSKKTKPTTITPDQSK